MFSKQDQTRDRDREREGETERETDRERQTETERQTDRQRQTDRDRRTKREKGKYQYDKCPHSLHDNVLEVDFLKRSSIRILSILLLQDYLLDDLVHQCPHPVDVTFPIWEAERAKRSFGFSKDSFGW